MKNIKLFLGVIVGLLILNLAKVIFNITFYNSLDDLLNADGEGHLLIITYVATIIVLCAAHLLVAMGLWFMIQYGYFNLRSIKVLNFGAVAFIAYGIISLCWRLYLMSYFNQTETNEAPQMVINAFENSYTIILGLAIITITTVLKDAHVLKSENDLTI